LQAAGMAGVHAGAKTCLVDFDLRCGSLSGIIGASAPGDRTLADLVDVIDEIRPLHIESLLREHEDGFSVICGPAPDFIGRAGFVDAVLKPLREMFDAIIIDLPPNPGVEILSRYIDIFYVVANPDTASAKSARSMGALLNGNRDEADITCVINRCDRADALKTDEVKQLSGLDIAAEVPEDIGAGGLFDKKGEVLADSPGLAVIRGLVPAVQRIREFEELKRAKRFALPDGWRPPWAATPDA
jgi:Flp pilus assembly CpaE family ATPase